LATQVAAPSLPSTPAARRPAIELPAALMVASGSVVIQRIIDIEV